MLEENSSLKESLRANLSTDEDERDNRPWYAIRLFTVRQKAVAEFLKENQFGVFIPEEYVDVEDSDHHIKHVLRPVVRNLLFIKKDRGEKEIKKIVTESSYKMSVVTKTREDRRYSEIPAHQMYEFQAMCNPELTMKKFLSEQQAHLKKGDKVLVKHGPLKGLTGRLVRSNKKYYLLQEIPGMAIMLKVTRWCCEAL